MPSTIMGNGTPTTIPIHSMGYISNLPEDTNITSYPQYSQIHSLRYPLNDWNAVYTTLPVQHTVYTVPTVPVMYSTQMYSPQGYAYSCNAATQTMYTKPEYPIEPTGSMFSTYRPVSYPLINNNRPPPIADEIYNTSLEENITQEVCDSLNVNMKFDSTDSLESYLKLPRELFPPPKSIPVDPNPIIDEICKLPNISDHTSWMLDLEFGVPRVPVTRHIAAYDLQMQSVRCKNTPGAIHPGFESCNSEFKNVFILYYDCIFSTWYRGYLRLNSNFSIDNFESWLQKPLQALGMCWP